jgi:hypothetical protein
MLAPLRKTRADACQIYAGLATGYLAIGHLADAAIAAALSIELGPVESCCWDAVDILFDERLLRFEMLSEMSVEFSTFRAKPEY